MTVKRAADVVTAGLLLAVTLPVFGIVALAQRIEGMPVLWRSPRLGRRGRRFDLLSFCTMRPTAAGTVDARLARTGRVLRDYSLDHLPTLVNVLRGDMSIVGPRPTEPDRADLADASWQRVLSVRPGMISYAVIRLARGYNAAPAEERLALEISYVAHAGIVFDSRLLVRAVVATLRSRGNVKARGRPMP
jgi:lipopolysaccharide/colanic/teichoic acid biosynthesis glycosyltransferase